MYHYTVSGLDNIWLANGYEIKQTSYGEAVAFQDAFGLQRAIGDRIARGRDLSGAEFRFIRKELDLSRRKLGNLLGVSEQDMARWEESDNVPETAGRLLRAIYIESVHGTVRIWELLETLSDLDHKGRVEMVFRATKDGWFPSPVENT